MSRTIPPAARHILWLMLLCLLSLPCAEAQYTEDRGGSHGGADWQPDPDSALGGTHVDIGTFRIPSGVVVRVAPWDGQTGGRLVVYARRIEILGDLVADGAGARGGTANGVPGEGEGGGGGGSTGSEWGGAGSGGGHGGAGGAGYRAPDAAPGTPGAARAHAPPLDATLGAGGGAAGASTGCSNRRGPGGNGGGAIVLIAGETLLVDGRVSAAGAGAPLGDARCGYRAGGGGGAGGTIVLQAPTLSLRGAVRAGGGKGGSGDGLPNTPACNGFGGGGGGGGRIWVAHDTAPAPSGLEVPGGAGGRGSGCSGGDGAPGQDGTVTCVSSLTWPPVPVSTEVDRHAGVLSEDGGLQADPGILTAILRGELRVPAAHPWHGRRLFVYDVRDPAEFADGRLPGARLWPGIDAAAAALGRDPSGCLFVYGATPADAQAWRTRCGDRLWQIGSGWEARIEWRRPDPRYAPATPGVALVSATAAPEITPEELRRRLDAGDPLRVIFLGSRANYEAARIPGAECVTFADFEVFFATLDRDAEFVVYCNCCAPEGPGVSGAYVNRLRTLGFRRVWNLAGHFAGWRERGFPVVEGAK